MPRESGSLSFKHKWFGVHSGTCCWEEGDAHTKTNQLTIGPERLWSYIKNLTQFYILFHYCMLTCMLNEMIWHGNTRLRELNCSIISFLFTKLSLFFFSNPTVYLIGWLRVISIYMLIVLSCIIGKLRWSIMVDWSMIKISLKTYMNG